MSAGEQRVIPERVDSALTALKSSRAVEILLTWRLEELLGTRDPAGFDQFTPDQMHQLKGALSEIMLLLNLLGLETEVGIRRITQPPRNETD